MKKILMNNKVKVLALVALLATAVVPLASAIGPGDNPPGGNVDANFNTVYTGGFLSSSDLSFLGSPPAVSGGFKETAVGGAGVVGMGDLAGVAGFATAADGWGGGFMDSTYLNSANLGTKDYGVRGTAGSDGGYGGFFEGKAAGVSGRATGPSGFGGTFTDSTGNSSAKLGTANYGVMGQGINGGYFTNPVANTTVYLGTPTDGIDAFSASGKAGYFTDGSSTVSLADGTNAIDAAGSIKNAWLTIAADGTISNPSGGAVAVVDNDGFQSTAAGGGGYGIIGRGSLTGVQGITTSSGIFGAGVEGKSTGNGVYGVKAISQGDGASAIYAEATGNSSNGVTGISSSGDGVVGNSTSLYGVLGQGGLAGGYFSNPGFVNWVWLGTSTYAIKATGNVEVTGNINASGNVNGGTITSNDSINAAGNITANSINSGDINASGNITANSINSGDINASGHIKATNGMGTYSTVEKGVGSQATPAAPAAYYGNASCPAGSYVVGCGVRSTPDGAILNEVKFESAVQCGAYVYAAGGASAPGGYTVQARCLNPAT